MKTPLYSVAIAGLVAYGVYSWMGIGKHEEVLGQTNDLKRENVKMENAIARLTKKYQNEKSQKEEAVSTLNETRANIEVRGTEAQGLQSNITRVSGQIETQQKEIADIQKLVEESQKVFADEGIDINELPTFIKDLNEERKQLNRKFEEVAIATEESQVKLDGKRAEMADLVKRSADRVESLAQNSISSLVSGVNNDWGFVIIKPHPRAKITADSQLMVVRGTQPIARVSINAIESSRVIADIDYDSLVPGARIRSGDRVILAKANMR